MENIIGGTIDTTNRNYNNWGCFYGNVDCAYEGSRKINGKE